MEDEMAHAVAVQHTHHRTYQLALIADAHHRALERHTVRNQIEIYEDTDMTDTPKIMTMRDLLEALSDDAWQKPPQGIDPTVRAEAKSNGWIETEGKTSGQRWHITPEGFAELERLRTGEPPVNDQAFRVIEDAINLEDPALRPALEPTVEQLNKVIKRLQFELHIFQKVETAIKPMMEEDGQSRDLLTYVRHLREGFRNENAIVTDINDMAAADSKGNMDPRDYVAMLREQVSHSPVIDWYAIVALPLIDFMLKDSDGALTLEHIQDDPARIVRYVNTIRQSLAHMDNIADERTKIIEQRDGQIESLNRCIEEQREQLQARGANARGHSALMLAETILDELCGLLPEVDAYRLAREQAVEAISTLKAKRS
jgi:hypothetical protein